MSDIDIKVTNETPEENNTEEKSEQENKTKSKKMPLKERLRNFFANPKKRLIFIICCGLFLIAVFGIGLYFLTHDNANAPVKTDDETDETTGALYQAPLDGIMIDQDSANRHPLAIVVENHTDARPQSGLSKASLVYEAIAEGGITRYMALYGTYESEKVGPVRSIRTFFVDWAHGFLAYLAHVGGNIDALDQIAAEKSLDLDQFKYSAPYWRERSTGLASEHTMYTSTLKLRDQATTNKYSAANNFNIYRFKEEPTEEEKLGFVEKQDVTINFSNNAKYEVVFKYDKATNSYKRYLAGAADIDNLTKTQITAKNIIVMSVKRKAVTTRINESGWEMTTVGTGTAKIYLDGKAINGTWRKDSKEARELFFDENGAEIVFNRGQFWICVVPPEVTPNVTN